MTCVFCLNGLEDRAYSGRPRTVARAASFAAFTRRVGMTHASATWLNLVEIWFGIIDPPVPSNCDTCGSVADLTTKIRTSVHGWNGRGHQFVWTRERREVVPKANRRET